MIVLGIFALNVQGVEGAIVQMVNHGIIIAALFLIAGAIEARIGHAAAGGLWRAGDAAPLAGRRPS